MWMLSLPSSSSSNTLGPRRAIPSATFALANSSSDDSATWRYSSPRGCVHRSRRLSHSAPISRGSFLGRDRERVAVVRFFLGFFFLIGFLVVDRLRSDDGRWCRDWFGFRVVGVALALRVPCD